MRIKMHCWASLAPIAGLWLAIWGLAPVVAGGQSLLDGILEKTPVEAGDTRSSVDPELRQRYELLVQRAAGDLSSGAERKLARAISELGPSVLPLLSCEIGPRNAGILAPPGSRDRVIRRALRYFGSSSLLEFARATGIGEGISLESRHRALRVLGEVRDPDTIDVALAIAGDIDPALLRSPVMAQSVRRTLAGCVSDPSDSMISRLELSWPRLDPRQRGLLIDAVVEARSSRSQPLLCGILGRLPESDPTILRALLRVPVQGRLDARSLRIVTGALRSGGSELQCGAAAVVAHFGEVDAAELLVELLDQKEARTRQAAHRALRQLFGLRISEDAERWRDWMESEQQWFESEGELCREMLTASEEDELTLGLATLTRHRLARGEFSKGLRARLEEPDAPSVIAISRALVTLRDLEAIPDLVALLDHEDELVRDAAHAALGKLTGLALPPDQDTWEAALR